MADPPLPVRSAPDIVVTERTRWYVRHPVVIRLTHWVNAVCLAILLMSGYQIFNAHPALYWGKVSDFDRPLLSMGAREAGGNLLAGEPSGTQGVTTLFGRSFTTTGLFGVSDDETGEASERGFPAWATLPSDQDLATGRRWHFLFAWVLVLNGTLYLAYGLASGQLRVRVLPSRDQIRTFWSSVREHLTLRFPQGDEAKRYNVIQKLTYLAVIFGLLPLQIAAGLAMSPGMDAVAPWLPAMFGGRQSARTVHFAVAHLLLAFVAVHVAMVVLSGLWNNMRGMVTGWFAIERRRVE